MAGIFGVSGADATVARDVMERMGAGARRSGAAENPHVWFAERCALGRIGCSGPSDALSGRRFAEKGSWRVVLNGSIYNTRELLREAGAEDGPQSDAFAIGALYERKAAGAVCHALRGMFSFALWDEKERTLLCARDRLGEKPLYYAVVGNTLLFASALKPLTASGLVDPELSARGLAEYLALTYVREQSNIYSNIRTLEPGSYLVWKEGAVSVERYWTPPALFDRPPSFNEAVEEVALLTKRAVSRCLASVDNVGVFLSGGLDSSTVAALASAERALPSFGFGFESKDERPFARAVAAMHGLDHTDLSDSGMDVVSLVRSLGETYGEPFGDSSAIPTLALCGSVGGRAKTILGGDGADELFGGYGNWYRPLLKLEGKKTLWGKQSRIMKEHWKDLIKFNSFRLRQFGLPAVPMPVYSPPSYTLDDALRMDINCFLPSSGIKKVERASRMHGLEVRSPFLDADLADFLIKLPPQYKISEESAKLLMREAFSSLWPEALRVRKKQGFGYDVGKWLKQPEMREFSRQCLGDSSRKIYSLFPARMLRRYAGQTRKKTWMLLVLSCWLEDAVWTSPRNW